ncbi:TerB N-terminal domain-containing protein [Eubacterium ruminantium]|uniref:TerB N-terminal domain-containing protein n=1 Tax=Eubacterium ruminantium TaxID=42322 RepID=UPI00247A1A8B|nr:TerB N-terminal domain-containing protein [Eubacterium ruminantium]
MRFLYSSGRIFNEVYKDEAIPLRPGYPLPEQIKDIRVVQKDDDKEGEDREDIFVHMARIMEEYSDDFRYEMKFKRHQPAYDILSDSELRGYFGWRTAYREGEVLKAETYPEIYEFELINGIGTTGPEDTYKKLLKLSEDYPSYREQIRKNINDFVVFNDLPAGLYLETASYRCDEDMHIIFGIDDEKKARGDFLKTLLRLAGDDIKDSGLYENELLEDSEEAAHFLFKEMDLYYSSKRKKSLKEELFGRKEAWPYNIFSGSVVAVKCKDEGYEYKLSEERSFRFMRGHWTVERHSLQNGAPGLIAGFLYCLEGCLKGEETKKNVPQWMKKLIYSKFSEYQENKRKIEERKVRIDLSRLDDIREKAAEIRDKLLVDNDVEATVGEIAVGETAESTSCDIDNIAGVDIDRSVGTTGDECEKETADDDIYNLTSDEVRLLSSLLKGEDINWVKEKGIFISVLIESINEKFYDEFGDSILVDDDYPEIYEDYREDIEDYLKRRRID